MECNDDQWIRLFNVSDPRRAYAGHTLYKVTSKLFQREYPEGSTEVAVWRRFSDFKKLHQELLKIYVHKHFKDEEFPRFPKAKFFGRFEDGVIEERRKAALDLLNFAGNIPDLFTSQPFVKFFEGGFPDSPNSNDIVVSRDRTLSEAEGGIAQGAKNYSIDNHKFSDDGVHNANSDDVTLGGVWLHKQPSVTEGLDNLSSDEEDDSYQVDLERRESNQEANLNSVEEHDDVFVNINEDFSEHESKISDREDNRCDVEPPKWLVRAISICSEGEDLEALASEADEFCFPEAFSDNDHGEGIHQGKSQVDSPDGKNHSKPSGLGNSFSFGNQSNPTIVRDNQTLDQDNNRLLNQELSAVKPEHAESKAGVVFEDSVLDANVISHSQSSFTSSSDSAKVITHQKTISDLGNILIDPKESDYLYAAGHTIHQALDYEVNGKYEEAFSLYRSCVGLLLSGVQEEKDAKRREAVRRKTAQYLLKAEALYNTYLTSKESSAKSEQGTLLSHPGRSICESDDLQKCKELTLGDLKVIGIVGKVMLVQKIHSGETYVVKAMSKSGPLRMYAHSHGNKSQRKMSVRHLYAKYPNIVQLYRFFETADTIYLLLEYAQGGQLWDYISYYHSHKESFDFHTGKPNQINEMDGSKLKNDLSVNDCKTYENGLTQGDLSEEDKPLLSKTRISSTKFSNQADEDCFTNLSGFVEQEKCTTIDAVQSISGIESMVDGGGASETNKTSVQEKFSENVSGVSPNGQCFIFKKLDEYFELSTHHLPNEYVKIWAAELVLAVAYLHTAGIICRDLNPKNILLDGEGHVLLTYFGSWEATEHVPDEEAMNHFYCAPEISQIGEVTAAADWWSVGALLYEIITGQGLSVTHPWGLHNHTELQLPNKIPPESKSLLKELLRVIPSERLGSGVNGIEEIKAHPFFNGISWAWLCSRVN